MRKPKTAYDPRQLEFTALVGGFFENTACRLLNAELADQDTGDILIPGINVPGEVKAKNNQKPVGIRLSQFRAHQSLVRNRTFEWYAYCLFGYNAKESRVGCVSEHRRSALTKCTSEKEFIDFMSRKTVRTYILDVQFIAAYHRHFGDQRGVMRGRENERHICLGHNYLRRFTSEGTTLLNELNLDCRDWVVNNRQVALPVVENGHTIALDVTCVLPKRLYRKVSQVMYTPREELKENEPF